MQHPRAPLTSLASVVEMTGDFSLTLPVMLAVAVASAVSRSDTAPAAASGASSQP